MKKPITTVLTLALAIATLSACKSAETMQDSPAQTPPVAVQPVDGATAVSVTTDEPADMVGMLVEKNLEARGGIDRIKAVESTKMVGDMSTMGMDMQLTIYTKRPGKMRSEISIPSMNMEMTQGFDGKTAWMLNPMAGSDPQILPDAMADAMADQSNTDGLLVGYEEEGHKLEYIGEGMVGEKPAHKLKLIREDKPDVMLFLDAETYLESMIEAESVNPQSGEKVLVKTYMNEYRDVQGMQMPFVIEVEMGGNVAQSMTLSSIELNMDLDDEIFLVPRPKVDVN